MGDCEKSLEKKGLQGHIEIPIVVIVKSKTFEVRFVLMLVTVLVVLDLEMIWRARSD